jgi:hypothetical protein
MVNSMNWKYPLLAMVIFAGLGADQNRPVPKFEGKSIPDPPRQIEPWTPPQTKLPRFLVSATAALFEQGMADPRGCEYREVEAGDGAIVKTRGFVLPERAGETGRFLVSWDGVVYPALSIGAVVDLDQDIRTLAESMKRARVAATASDTNRYNFAGRFTASYSRGGMWNAGGPPGADGRSALKLCLLLRLGRADLAELLFAAGTTWSPEVHGNDLTDYQISYLTLANDRAAAVYIRLVAAHMRGDDVVALDAARRLSAFAKAVDQKAAAMGFPIGQGYLPGDTPSYLPFLRRFPDLLADQERRTREPVRGPIPKHGGDPSARIDALIRDLDQIDLQIMPGSGYFEGTPLVRALIAEGDPAVEPLLAALETDMRLTRSASYGRGMAIERSVQPAFEAELAALTRILDTNEFANARSTLLLHDLAGRKALAREIRVYWEKNRRISLLDRWYRTLSDDAAGRDRWLETANRIIEPIDNTGFIAPGPRKSSPPPMKGEALRSRRAPSVSELLARRVSGIARAGNPLSIPDIELIRACELALVLDRWDGQAALPVVRALMARCREGIELRRAQDTQAEQYLSKFVAQFTILRARAGEREALDEYAAWVRKLVPKELERQTIACFEPMWTYPDRPAIVEAARWMFNDPRSPWVPMRFARETRSLFFFSYDGSLYNSPLLRVAGFRDGLIAAMANQAELGTVRHNAPRSVEYKLTDGGGVSFSSLKVDLDAVKLGVDFPFRVCDFIAWQVSSIEGAPECELYWPQDRRDRAVAGCSAYVKQYGDRFTADAPPGETEYGSKRAHLAFPPPGRPASLADVREGRAIFSLEGQGEVRLASVGDFPIKARWVRLQDFPVYRQGGDGEFRREYDQDGWIWQAEEVRKGDRWDRSYGFVGRHVIGRVAAADIELDPGPFYQGWGPLPGGLDASIEPAERVGMAYEPARPIRMTLRIRNRRGVENTAPTEYLRRGIGDRTALRRGLVLTVFYSLPRPTQSGQGQGGPQEELKPKRTESFIPGDAARPLAPFQAFDALRLDLDDWFDLTRPGSYRARAVFSADSGLGEGKTNDWYFNVGNSEGPLP